MDDSPLRVAHVDDDDDLRALVRMALVMSDETALVSCESGKVAQRIVPAFKPDVLLVDMMMPGMDGIQTVAALSEQMDMSSVSIVFATASDDAEQMRRFREAGAIAVINKPFDAMQLGARLKAIHRA